MSGITPTRDGIHTQYSIIHYLFSSPHSGAFLAEMEGFEPPVPKSTTDFESASLRPLRYISVPLRTAGVLYQPFVEKSRFFTGAVILFYKLQYFPQLFANTAVVFPAVGAQTAGAVLDSFFIIGKATAAVIPQGIQGAIAKQAAEPLRIRPGMAGKILAFLVLKKNIMAHIATSFPEYKKWSRKQAPWETLRRLVLKVHPVPGNGMPKADGSRIQRNLAGVVQGGIFSFSHQGKAPAGKLNPNLVGSAGMKPDFQL